MRRGKGSQRGVRGLANDLLTTGAHSGTGRESREGITSSLNDVASGQERASEGEEGERQRATTSKGQRARRLSIVKKERREALKDLQARQDIPAREDKKLERPLLLPDLLDDARPTSRASDPGLHQAHPTSDSDSAHQATGKRANTPAGAFSSPSSPFSPSALSTSSLYGNHTSSLSTATPAPPRLKRQYHSTTSVACQTRRARSGWSEAKARKRVV